MLTKTSDTTRRGHQPQRSPAHLLPALLLLLTLFTPTIHAQTAYPGIVEIKRAGNAGPVLLLIPGLGLDASAFDPFIEAHKDDHRILAVTLLGMNGEKVEDAAPFNRVWNDDRTPSPWLDRTTESLAALILDEAPGSKAIVIGHSMGGHLALRLAANHKDLVAAAITLDGRPVYEAPGLPLTTDRARRARQVWRVQAETIARVPDEGWTQVLSNNVRQDVKDPARAEVLAKLVARTDPTVMKRYYLELLASDARPALAESKVPVLAIVGPFFARPKSEEDLRAEWDELTKNTTIRVEPVMQGGHWPLENATERTNELIDAFINEVTDQG
jgi:pimeloyl-ACP methyl ester carboxylesterase